MMHKRYFKESIIGVISNLEFVITMLNVEMKFTKGSTKESLKYRVDDLKRCLAVLNDGVEE